MGGVFDSWGSVVPTGDHVLCVSWDSCLTTLLGGFASNVILYLVAIIIIVPLLFGVLASIFGAIHDMISGGRRETYSGALYVRGESGELERVSARKGDKLVHYAGDPPPMVPTTQTAEYGESLHMKQEGLTVHE